MGEICSITEALGRAIVAGVEGKPIVLGDNVYELALPDEKGEYGTLLMTLSIALQRIEDRLGKERHFLVFENELGLLIDTSL